MISIENQIELHNQKKTNLLKVLEEICSVLENSTNFDNPSELLSILDELKLSLEKSHYNIEKLEELNAYLSSASIQAENYNELSEKYEKEILENDIYIEKFFNKYILFHTLNIEPAQNVDIPQPKSENNQGQILQPEQDLKIEQPIQETQDNTIEQPNTEPHTENKQELKLEQIIVQKHKTEINQEEKPKQELQDNDTLLISETKGKVFLPYKIQTLEEILQRSNKYNNIEEIINDKYILPISYFKSPMYSRFKEAYNLMRNKENASFIDSISLGLELSVNTYLNPAIITACSNIDELDIYLDYLAENKTDKFKIFKIEYEVLPTKKSRSN